MQTGYYNAAAAMVVQFNRLNTIANNLANVNTVGYKENDVIIGDFMRIYKNSRDELENQNNTKEAAKFLNRTLTKAPQIVDSYTKYSIGNIQKTDNQLDIAITKEDLFFVVKTPQGIRLTKNGSFTTNDEGKLVTKEGFEVLPSDYKNNKEGIRLDVANSIINIDKDGKIYKDLPNGVKMIQSAKLFIAQPDNMKLLIKEGANLYKYEDMQTLESVENSGAIKQGFVEKSNVNAVSMMTQMIEANRLVGMYRSAMDTQMNEMNKDAIEKIARKA